MNFIKVDKDLSDRSKTIVIYKLNLNNTDVYVEVERRTFKKTLSGVVIKSKDLLIFSLMKKKKVNITEEQNSGKQQLMNLQDRLSSRKKKLIIIKIKIIIYQR